MKINDVSVTYDCFSPVRGRVPGRCYQRVDQNIDRYDVHSEFLIANDAPDRTSSDFHHDARDAAHIVHPSFERFSPRSGHFKHDTYSD